MKYNTTTKETDIMMFNSRNLGALIVDEDPHVKSWDEPMYSIQHIGIEETYGFGILNEGQAIAVRRNGQQLRQQFAFSANPVVNAGPNNDDYTRCVSPLAFAESVFCCRAVVGAVCSR